MNFKFFQIMNWAVDWLVWADASHSRLKGCVFHSHTLVLLQAGVWKDGTFQHNRFIHPVCRPMC